MADNPRRIVDWTSEMDQTIISLRARKLPWKEISERVGRTVEACSSRYRTIIPREERALFLGKRWTREEVATLNRLLAEGISQEQIALQVGKTRSAVYSKMLSLTREERRVHLERVPRLSVPARCLEDRDRRLSAERDLTSEFFGDPRPGQSALDKKRGIIHEATSPRSAATYQTACSFPQGSPPPRADLVRAQALDPSPRV